jgi:hypothetical protein
MSGNRGEGENFFSREKIFSPSPRTPHPLSKKAVFFLGLPLVAPAGVLCISSVALCALTGFFLMAAPDLGCAVFGGCAGLFGYNCSFSG